MTKESLGNRVIDCKKYADDILSSISGYGHLAVISVGGDPASVAYNTKSAKSIIKKVYNGT